VLFNFSKVKAVPIYTVKADILQHRAEKSIGENQPLSDAEKMIYVKDFNLINTSNHHLPKFDAIITEKEYYQLFKADYYKPCKFIDFFYIISENQSIDQKEIDEWAFKHFEYNFDLTTNNDQHFAIIRFKSNGHEMSKRCNIINNFFELKDKDQFLKLDFSKSDAYELVPDDNVYYNSFLYLNNVPDIINNIETISRSLIQEYQCPIEDGQAITLQKLRKNSRILKGFSIIVVTSILISLLFYICMTFTLFIQTRIHMIGMMKSMGATSRSIIWIYIYESLKLIAPSLIFALVIAWAVQHGCYLILTDIVYVFHYPAVMISVAAIFLITTLGALLAAWHVVSRPPYELLSYQV
jgi:ABC-type antimicrobial peptide transport system permease subunit